MKTINKDTNITIRWKVVHGENKVGEKFESDDNLKVFLVGSHNTYWINPWRQEDSSLQIVINGGTLGAGVYDIKAIWQKNHGRNLLTSVRSDLFAITDDIEEAAPVESEELRIVSYVESYGRDGMSAYETAVMRGLTMNVSEYEWVKTLDDMEKSETSRQTAEANRVIEEAKRESAEKKRQSTFEANESNRETTFATEKGERKNSFIAEQQERANAYEMSEGARSSEFKLAEASRQSSYNQSEIQRQQEFVEKEAIRNSGEANRQAAFEQGEVARQNAFDSNEATRQKDYADNEAFREAAETKREAAETKREQTFTTNEAQRIATFDANETTRIAAENERKQNEAKREANEAIRQESYKDKLPVSAVVQETGDGENVVMSQKAVSEKLNKLGSYVSNPEYARAYTDAEDRFLWGIKHDGSIEFAKGVPTPIKEYIHSIDRNNDEEIERINNLLIGLINEVASINRDVTGLTDTYHYISNEEWIMAVTDSESRILIGLKADGSIHIPNRELFYKTSNEEYLQVVVDNNNNILFGIRADGSIYIPKGISDEAKKGLVELTLRISILEGLYNLEHNPEYISVTTDKDGRILEGIDSKGEKFFSKQALFNKYNDAEGRLEIVVDANNKVISYRDKDGVLNEYKINTREFASEHLNLTNGNAVEIQDALRRAGVTFQTPNDFSEKTNIEIPIPRVCASARILVPKMPTTKTADIEGYLEYYDKDGNYFKKAIILNSQGSSSMGYIRPDGSQGNLSVDFADCKIKFGNWVAQDSFHIKKYYIDAFRGQCVVGYHLMEQVYQTHPYGEKKPYDTIIQNDSITDSSGKIKKDYNTGALCHPDGFPVVIYVNTGGEDIFYGVYAWCLKKHRDNYYCDKANPDNIILDGVITKNTLFGGRIDWTQFEIRNPKDLIDINGNEYDGDNPKELSNTDELSAAVKNNIVRLSGVVDAMTANNSKETFEQYFLPKYFIDYYIISQVIYNVDGFHKNWIWCTWDGQHWTPTLYDVDSIFGMMPIGTYVNGASANTGLLGEVVTSYLTQSYSDEIKERYHELRDKGVFSVDNIVGLLESWIKKIGYQNLKDDLERFNQTPSYRKSYLNDEVWELVSYSWNTSNNDYDEDKTYNVGDTCYFYGYLMKAKIQNIGLAPFNQIYNNHPQASGFYNSLARVKNWLTERISFLDRNYDYTNF